MIKFKYNLGFDTPFFIEIIRNNMNNNYEFNLEENFDCDKVVLMNETKCILAYIFLHYWGTKDQISIIEKKFKQDIIEAEKLKKKFFQGRDSKII